MFTKTEVAVGIGLPFGFSAIAIGAVKYIVAQPDVGDLLSFIGALFGAASAVAGAIYVEERRRRIAANEEQQPILDAITGLREALADLRQTPTLSALHDQQVEKAKSVLARIYNFFPPRSPRLLIRRDALNEALGRLHDACSAAYYEGQAYPERQLNNEITNTIDSVNAVARQLAQAHRDSR